MPGPFLDRVTKSPGAITKIYDKNGVVTYWEDMLSTLISQMTEFAFDTGVTTSASAGGTQVIDATKSWAANIWDQTHRKAVVEIIIGGIHYFADVTANAATTLTFGALGVAVPIGATYAIKAGFGSVDISSISSTALTADDWTARFKALNDASVTGMFKSFGDAGAGDSLLGLVGTKGDAAVTDDTASSTLFGYIKGLLKDIGDVGGGSDLLTLTGLISKKKQSDPAMYVVDCAVADTQYSQVLPANTKMITVKMLNGLPGDNFRVSFVTGNVATGPLVAKPCDKIDAGMDWVSPEGMDLAASTVYFASSVTGLCLVTAYV